MYLHVETTCKLRPILVKLMVLECRDHYMYMCNFWSADITVVQVFPCVMFVVSLCLHSSSCRNPSSPQACLGKMKNSDGVSAFCPVVKAYWQHTNRKSSKTIACFMSEHSFTDMSLQAQPRGPRYLFASYGDETFEESRQHLRCFVSRHELCEI